MASSTAEACWPRTLIYFGAIPAVRDGHRSTRMLVVLDSHQKWRSHGNHVRAEIAADIGVEPAPAQIDRFGRRRGRWQ
eukprot:scaffold1386_cov119-Isochrysis_galbana.AAC.9